jgi:predicted amidophosphoribosyltransferase
MKFQGGYLADFLALFFPQLCPACGAELVAHEKVICTDCNYNLPLYQLPFTGR